MGKLTRIAWGICNWVLWSVLCVDAAQQADADDKSWKPDDKPFKVDLSDKNGSYYWRFYGGPAKYATAN